MIEKIIQFIIKLVDSWEEKNKNQGVYNRDDIEESIE